MKIAIIGSGNVGGALGVRLGAMNHEVIFGVRDVNQFSNRHLLNKENISAQSVEEAVKNSEVVIVACPASVVHEVAKQIAPLVGDKVIIDTSNAMFGAPEGYTSGFLALQDITKAPNIVKCFNSTFAANMDNPQYGDDRADMFIAGSSKRAKEVATKLAKDVGFGEVYDFGDDDKVPLVESLTPIVVNLAYGQGMGPTFALKLLRR